MTLQWKPYKDKESVFWSEFKQDGDIGLIAKFKGSDPNGYNPDVSVRAELDGYVYSAKAAVSKKTGKPFYVIERKQTSSLGDESEEQKAANSVARTDYSDGAKKGHEENVAMHKERMAIERELITAINALIDILRTTKQV